MTFGAPMLLAAGAAAALGIVVLHLLSTRRPPPAPLPTARFVPESEARAVSRSSKPTDLLLLALRALAVLLVGAAFARPLPDAPGPSVRTVVLLDRSAVVEDAGAAAREATRLAGEGGAIVMFDTTARRLDEAGIAGLAQEAGARAADAARARPSHGILSSAFVAGIRAAREVARGADSVRLAIVSPLTGEEIDAATRTARASWPGGVEIVRVAGVADTMRAPRPALVTRLADDPIAPAIAALEATRGAHDVRIVRTELTASLSSARPEPPSAADSAWLNAVRGRVLLVWPTTDRAPSPDGATAFGARAATIVAPLVRLPLGADPTGRAVARWRDGALAAIERPLGDGCVREIGVGVPSAGDLTLRPAFQAFLGVLVEPCGGARGVAISDSIAAELAGPPGAVAARTLTAAGATDPRLAAWLLAAALALLVIEWALRGRRRA